MKTGEQRLWAYLNKQMKEYHGDRWHATRIETGATALGQPDVNYCLDGVEGNLELKFIETEKGRCILRPSQCQWMVKRHRAGGKDWILLEVGSPEKVRSWVLISSRHAEELIINPHHLHWVALATAGWYGQLDAETLSVYLKGKG